MTAPGRYATITARLDGAVAEFAAARSAVDAEWQDAAADAVRPALDAAAGAVAGIRSSLDRQSERHDRVVAFVELIERERQDAEALVEQSWRAVHDAESALAEAGAASDEARGAASASSRTLERALALAGRAGAACGHAVGSGALEGRMQSRVVGARTREVWKLVARSVGIETVHIAAGAAAETLLGIPDGALPQSFTDDVEEAAKLAAPLARARITAAVERLSRDLGSRG